MKPGDAEYDLLVERLRRERKDSHKKQMPVIITCRYKGEFKSEPILIDVSPKKRGRPKGSRNKPK